MKQLNLVLKFLLELGALAAIGLWGASIADGPAAVLPAVGLPVITAVLWGAFAAPRARHRLRLSLRAPFELGVFGLAALALWSAASAAWGAAFALIAVANAVLLTAFDQWEA
jgi:hypothetical protein